MRTKLADELPPFIDVADFSEDDVPSNDNGLGFHYVDLETDFAANDNGEYEDFDDELADDPRDYGFVEAQPGRLEHLLDQAGYDPAAVPVDLRRTAFEVALCFQKRLFDPGDIAQSTSFTRGQVRRATEALRRAARPGTRVG